MDVYATFIWRRTGTQPTGSEIGAYRTVSQADRHVCQYCKVCAHCACPERRVSCYECVSTSPEHAQSHRLLERLGVTDMSYLFNSMVSFNADISALGLTGHIRVCVILMQHSIPISATMRKAFSEDQRFGQPASA